MYRILVILFGGTLAMLIAAGGSTIAYKTTKQSTAQQRVRPAESVGSSLAKHLRDLGDDMALP
jgi:hypothetical protein